MSSKAWKCRCARLIRGRGRWGTDYNCEVKQFFLPMLPYERVGGWKKECCNFRCSSRYNGECEPGNNTWCDMALVRAVDWHYAAGCTCPVDHCPFFRPRTADEWMSAVRHGEVPFLTRNGTLCQEAKNAKNYFALSDEVFDGLVEEMKARLKKKGGEE